MGNTGEKKKTPLPSDISIYSFLLREPALSCQTDSREYHTLTSATTSSVENSPL